MLKIKSIIAEYRLSGKSVITLSPGERVGGAKMQII
jgi:hypothetical protein